MKKRILALLLAASMFFSNEGFVSYAMNSSATVINEAVTEETETVTDDLQSNQNTEAESSSETDNQSDNDSDNDADKEASVVETETNAENATTEETETNTESTTAVETETSTESTTAVETETSTESTTAVETETETESAVIVETETNVEAEATIETETDILTDAEVNGDFEYSYNNSGATITGYTGTDAIVSIPAEIDGYTVVAIGSYAFEDNKTITEVTIPDSVTSIGNSAFYYCSKLANVTIGNNITTIGNYAFQGCAALSSITLGSAVKSIGSSAFNSCTSLSSVTLNNGLETIGGNAFYGCTALQSITIPKSVTSIGQSAFNNSIKEVAFESGMTSIPNYACYYATNLEKITIPDSVTSIGSYAFYYCTKLANVTIGNNITSISNNAFQNCYALTSVKLGSGVKSIGNFAFGSCTALSSVTLNAGLESIGGNAFDGCTALVSITIPKSVTSISQNAFKDGVKEITFEAGMTTIPENACDRATKLEKVTIPDTVTTIGNLAFYECISLSEIILPNSVTSIGNRAFCWCTKLSKITLSNSVTSIGDYAFQNCKALTEINLPDTLTSIGNYAFQNCKALESVTLPKSLTTIGKSLFYECGVKEVVFSDGLTEIPANACSGASNLETVTLPSSVTLIGNSAFSGCSKLSNITLGEGITIIESYAFSGCYALNNVNLPDSLTKIGSYAFQSCEALTEITIKDNATVDAMAFQYCSALTKVTIGNNVKVGNYAFYNCSALEELVIGDNVTLGNYAFGYCTALKKLTMGENVTRGNNVFYQVIISGTCGENLTWTFEFEGEELFINGNGAMTDYASETEVPWYSYNSSIKLITIGDNITSIGNYAFKDCDNFTSIYLPEGIKSIGEYAFYSCDSLEYIEIPKTTEKIGKNAFAECKNLVEIIFCGDAPTLDSTSLPDFETTTVYYPETGTGWIERILNKFKYLKWLKWDNTVPTKDVVLVLDTSGSMSGRMEQLKESSITFVKGVGGRLTNTRISVVEYNSYAQEISAFSTNSHMHIRQIMKLEDGGGTYYIDALNCADQILKKSKADYKFIVLFSDGEPSDSKTEISALAAQLRKVYKIYTVGLLSGYSETQKKTLIDVAGGEENYFEATNIEGLLQAFLNLMDDFGKNADTTVELKRNNDRYDLLADKQEICVGSPEKVSIIVTPGTKYENAGILADNIALVQNGNVIIENDTGIFEDIVPGNIFQKGQGIYAVLSDSKGNEIESLELKLTMRENFVITYMMNDGTDKVYMEQKVVNGNPIEKPADPVRLGYKLAGWYTSEACDGISFFSAFNILNRLEINSDITLYAKWKIDSSKLDLETDAYSFTNSPDVFGRTGGLGNIIYPQGYEITAGDYAKLTNGISETDLDGVENYKTSQWGGSCFGISSSLALMYENTIDISDFDTNYLYPGEIKDLKHNENGDSDVGAVESMINYYHLRQKIGNVKNAIWTGVSYSSESNNIEQIINKLKSQKYPVVLVIYLYNSEDIATDLSNGTVGGHAVVAYNLKEDTANNTYTFEVYDCSLGNDNAYTVTVAKSGENYSAECEDWENAWTNYNHIFLLSALTVESLKSESVLTKPEVIETSSINSENSNVKYELEASYPSFKITNGTKYAVVKNCKKVEGDLQIECVGPINFIGESPNYLFRLPILNSGETYTITPESAGSYKTNFIYNDKNNGFSLSEESDKAGTIVISASGKISAKYPESANFKAKVVANGSTTPWYSTNVSGKDTGFSAQVQKDKANVTTDNAITANVELKTRFDKINIESVEVGSAGIEITSSNKNECVINKDGKEIFRKGLGYSVVFDSQLGTSVETLTNIADGSVIQEPDDPKRPGYIFQGWFKEGTCENAWDFANDKITSDTILYAGWSLDANYFVNVSFEIPGIETQSIYLPKGSKIELSKCPEIPADLEQTWYVSDNYVDVWEFENDTVIENMVLYAKGKLCTISFNTACNAVIEPYTVYAGKRLEKPVAEIEREGYTLCGWSTDASGKTDWDFASDRIMDDTTLYARWIANERDNDNNDTKICIEVKNPDSYVYTGKKITPQIIVRDGNNILKPNQDYKITYKNNVNVCDIASTDISDSKKPQIIIQGIGSYKANKKFVKNFSIAQAEMSDLTVEVPSYVAGKANDKLQKINPVVKLDNITIPAKQYTVAYYTDAALKEKVDGLTKAGTYYVVVEAVKNNEGKYTGNCKGKSDVIAVNVVSSALMLSNAKINVNKNIKCDTTVTNSDAAIKAIISKITIGSNVYETSDEKLEILKQYFDISGIDEKGNIISSNKIQLLLKTGGTKNLVIKAKEGNDKGYAGEKQIKFTVKGQKLDKNKFKLTFDTSSQSPVTSVTYTGSAMTPSIVSDLTVGKDYTVTYQYNKKTVSAGKVKNAGTYTAVITGINQYSGTVSLKFTIKKLDLASAYADGKLSVSSNETTAYSAAGAKISYSIAYDYDGADKAGYKTIKLNEGTDYTISYKNNKKVTNDKILAYGIVKGKGNFSGTLKGDGKPTVEGESLKKGVSKQLNYTITKKSLSSDDISIVVDSVKVKNGKKNTKVYSVKYTLYDNGNKIPSNQYTDSCYEYGNRIYLSINAKTDANYISYCYAYVPIELIKVSDSKNVKIAYKEKANYYYSGSQIKPEITITDKDGNDISAYFNVEYGENVNIGFGTIKITGKLENSYCGTKVLKFTILPKWLQWIF